MPSRRGGLAAAEPHYAGQGWTGGGWAGLIRISVQPRIGTNWRTGLARYPDTGLE